VEPCRPAVGRPEPRARNSRLPDGPDPCGNPTIRTDEKGFELNTYRVHIRSDEFQYESDLQASNIEEEDGWTVFWRGKEVFMRIRDEHIVSLERLS
jgi:hypothetical protein